MADKSNTQRASRWESSRSATTLFGHSTTIAQRRFKWVSEARSTRVRWLEAIWGSPSYAARSTWRIYESLPLSHRDNQPAHHLRTERSHLIRLNGKQTDFDILTLHFVAQLIRPDL